MESISRRNIIGGAAVAAAAAAVAAVAAFADEAAAEGNVIDLGAVFDYGIPEGTHLRPAAEPSSAELKPVVVIDSSATVGGNGDTLADTVCTELEGKAAVTRFNLRNMQIGFVTQHGDVPPVDAIDTDQDAMAEIIPAIHEAEAIICICPTIYNGIDPRLLTMLSRFWQPTWNNADWQLGPMKRLGALITCTGSSPDWLKASVESYVTLPAVECSISETRTEVFTMCSAPTTCAETEEFLETARDVARWVIE